MNQVISGKAWAREIKECWLQDAREGGTPLQWIRAGVYQSPGGKRLAIACARQSSITGSWSFTISRHPVDVVVLLLDDGERIIEFALPSSVLAGLVKREDGIRINVSQRGGEYYLSVPGRDAIPLRDWQDMDGLAEHYLTSPV